MFKLHLIQAAFGDSLLLEYGSGDKPQYVLIDGGPRGTYKNHLRKVLEPLGQNGAELGLVMLSHVDTDHVTGLVDFFAELRDQKASEETLLIPAHALWHNSFGRTVDPEGTIAPRFAATLSAVSTANVQTLMSHSQAALLGIADGNKLRVLAMQLGISINDGFADVITTDTAPDPIPLGELSLRVVGPTPANLEALRQEWEEWLEEHENVITDEEPLVMANADKSIPNLSSICVLATAEDRTLLLTGDARGDHILDGLSTAGLLDENGRLHVDVFKLPHHGSNRNITKTFFKKITADRYAVSADGKHGNPDYDTLTWVVEAAHEGGRQIEIIATNATPSTEKLLQDYPPDQWGYTLTIMPDHFHYYTVQIA